MIPLAKDLLFGIIKSHIYFYIIVEILTFFKNFVKGFSNLL
jgi:hypothetical protein